MQKDEQTGRIWSFFPRDLLLLLILLVVIMIVSVVRLLAAAIFIITGLRPANSTEALPMFCDESDDSDWGPDQSS